MEHPDWPKCKVTAEAGKRARLQRQIPRHNHRCIFAKPQNMEIDFQDMKNSSQVITSAGTVLNTIMFTHFNSFSLLFHHILFLPEPYCRPIYVNRRYDGKLGKDGGKRSHRPKTGFISTPTTGHTPNHSAKRPIHCQATRRSPIRLTAPSITRSTEWTGKCLTCLTAAIHVALDYTTTLGGENVELVEDTMQTSPKHLNKKIFQSMTTLGH